MVCKSKKCYIDLFWICSLFKKNNRLFQNRMLACYLVDFVKVCINAKCKTDCDSAAKEKKFRKSDGVVNSAWTVKD